jgi:O-antigen ligase
MIFSKAEDYSGIGRLNSVLLAFNYFRAYPFLGIGWGSATSYDLVGKILSNTGILGLIPFALFVRSLFSGLWTSMQPAAANEMISEQTYWAICLSVASFILIVTNELTGFAFVYGHLWFIFGMALAVPVLHDLPRRAVAPRTAND